MQLFDEVQTLRGDGKRFDALVTVLNVGFDARWRVTRVHFGVGAAAATGVDQCG